MALQHIYFFQILFYVLLELAQDAAGDGESYRYLGCYTDMQSQRDLSGIMMSIPGITVEQCAGRCQLRGYPYAGLQIKELCFCGMSFGTYGPSFACNTTCNGQYCGGHLNNDVYYTLDARYSVMVARSVVLHSKSKSFNDGRMDCLTNNGDLTRLNSEALLAAINKATTSVASAWIGLMLVAGSFAWAESTGLDVTYLNEPETIRNYWDPNEQFDKDCVMFNTTIRLMQTAWCTQSMPYLCFQIPPPPPQSNDTSTGSPNASESGSVSAAKLLALYIVVPLFSVCYCASCVIYCAHKIYTHCMHHREENKWKNLDKMLPPPQPTRIPYPIPKEAGNFNRAKKMPSNYPVVYIADSKFKQPEAYTGNVVGHPAPSNAPINMYNSEELLGAAAWWVQEGTKPPEYSKISPAYVHHGDNDDDEIGAMQTKEILMNQNKMSKKNEFP